MLSKTLEYQGHTLHYRRYGQGDKHLIGLHGFGDDSGLWAKWEDSLQNHSLWALDLPWHGQTQWQGRIFLPQDILGLIESLCQIEGIAGFQLLGYSMGGHIAQYIAPFLGSKLQGLWLIAPAAMQDTAAHNRQVFNPWVRRLLRRSLDNPKVLQSIFVLAQKLKLLNAASFRFFSKQLQNPEQRHKMLDVWVSLYYFPVNKKRLAQFLLEHQLPLYFFYGQKDKITPESAARQFAKGLEGRMPIHWFQTEDNHFLFKQAGIYQALSQALTL